MKASVIWNPDHDMAAIVFGRAYAPNEPPSEPVNHILEVMYNANRDEQAGLQLYMYEIWDGDKLVGLVFAESMEEDESEMLAQYNQIIQSDQAVQQTGRYERKEFDA